MSSASGPDQHALPDLLDRYRFLEQPPLCPGFTPPADALAHRIGFAKRVRSIRPWKTGPQQVADAFDEATVTRLLGVLPNPADYCSLSFSVAHSVSLSIGLVMDVASFGSTPHGATSIDRQKIRSTCRLPVKSHS